MDGPSGCGEAVWRGDMTLEVADGSERAAGGTVITCIKRWPVSGPIVMSLGHQCKSPARYAPTNYACPLSFVSPSSSPTNPLVQAIGALLEYQASSH